MGRPRRVCHPWVRAASPVVAAVLLTGCATGDSDGSAGPAAVPLTGVPTSAPALLVQTVLGSLDHPWDVAQAPDGTLLVDQRAGGLTAVLPDGTVRPVVADLGDLHAAGEVGLMGLVLDPEFAQNRRLYTCQGVRADGDQPASIAVVAWQVADDWSAATRVAGPLLGGIPRDEATDRHGGCRLCFDPAGALLVGTGDATTGRVPQDPASLGGKVLRVDPATGAPLPGDSTVVWTSGHRNVQGLAVRPGNGPGGGQVYAAEHGPDRDDEVTLLRPGGNGGWDPAGPGGRYDQSVPMSDPATPEVMAPSWASGDRTIAVGGATFLDGDQWGDHDGLLLVAVLEGRGVLALRLDETGTLREQFRLPELEGTVGRVRTVQQGTDGALYVTTDDGDGEDRLLRVTPR